MCGVRLRAEQTRLGNNYKTFILFPFDSVGYMFISQDWHCSEAHCQLSSVTSFCKVKKTSNIKALKVKTTQWEVFKLHGCLGLLYNSSVLAKPCKHLYLHGKYKWQPLTLDYTNDSLVCCEYEWKQAQSIQRVEKHTAHRWRHARALT